MKHLQFEDRRGDEDEFQRRLCQTLCQHFPGLSLSLSQHKPSPPASTVKKYPDFLSHIPVMSEKKDYYYYPSQFSFNTQKQDSLKWHHLWNKLICMRENIQSHCAS